MERAPIKTPFWEMPRANLVRAMDALFDIERYSSLLHFTETLDATAEKNPVEFQFYIDVLKMRLDLTQGIMDSVNKKVINTDG